MLRRLRGAVVTALVLATSAAPLCAQAGVEVTLVELRLGRAASLAVRAEVDGTRLWVPVAELAAALELEVVSRSASRVTLRRWPSRDLLVFDRDSNLVRRGATSLSIAPQALRSNDGDLLVDVTTLELAFRTPFETSLTDLVVSIPLIDSLPLGRRVSRERARARLTARDAAGTEPDVAPLARPLADGAVLDYTLNAPLTGAQRSIGWSTALGLDVLGGSLEVSSGAITGGARLPTLSSWTGVWRRGRKLTQLRLGDGLGSGPAPRLGRGLMLTNAPFMRPALFGLQTLRGDLPPGWTIEAYRNGELMAVDTVGRASGYQLQLPVLYGDNPVDLLAVGPFGQTRALTENLRIASELLPRGRTEYGASVAQCRLRNQCRAAGTLDLRVGLADRWTMRVGLDAVARDSAGLRQAPYVALSGAPLPSVAVQLDAAARSRARMAVNLEPSRQLRLSMEQSWFSTDPLDPLVTSRRRMQSSVYGYWRSLDARQSSLDASLDRSVFLDGGDLTRARIGYSTQASGVRLQPYVRHDQSSRGGYAQSLAGFEAMVLPSGRLGRYAGAALLRVIGEVDARGHAQRQAMTLSMPLPGAFRMDGGVVLQRGSGGALTTLTLSRDLAALRSYTTATMAASGGGSASQSLQGSALLAPGERRPQFVTGPSLQRTGVAGTVFLDRNLNGRRDAGEPVVPGVTVQVGTGWARTDADGRYRVWDLVPFVVMSVSVDSTTLPSPLWVPSVRHTSIEAGPNRFEPLDIPLVSGGVLEGRVIWRRPGGLSLPAVPLMVMDARGTVIARTLSFSDGEFVLFGVRPGALTVRIDPAWLASQHLTATEASATLQSNDEGATVRVSPLTINGGSSVNQCAPGAGPGCSRSDDEVLEGGGDEGIRLTQSHVEKRDSLVVSPEQRQHDVTFGATRTGVDLNARHARHLAVGMPRVDADHAGSTPIDPETEQRGIGVGRNGAQRQPAGDHRGGGDDRAVLCLRRARDGDAGQQQRGDAEGAEVATHDTESRQGSACTRDARRRTDYVTGKLPRPACAARTDAPAMALAPRRGSRDALPDQQAQSSRRRAPVARFSASGMPRSGSGRRTPKVVASPTAGAGDKKVSSSNLLVSSSQLRSSKGAVAPVTPQKRARRSLRRSTRRRSAPAIRRAAVDVCADQPC